MEPFVFLCLAAVLGFFVGGTIFNTIRAREVRRIREHYVARVLELNRLLQLAEAKSAPELDMDRAFEVAGKSLTRQQKRKMARAGRQ